MNAKYFIIIIFISALTACTGKNGNVEHAHESGEKKSESQPDTVRKSIPREVHAQVGKAHVMIKYHAPAVRGRTIWGGLVPYGEVWVTGAHSATSFEIDKPFTMGETEIPAGKYALFTIPDKEMWTFIVNKNWDQHLADEYAATDDVVRVTVKAEQLEESQERLKYAVVADANADSKIQVRWEKVRISVPFRIN